MRQQPGEHISITHGAFPKAEIRLADFGGGGVRPVEDRAGVPVEQHVGLGRLVRLWRLGRCGQCHAFRGESPRLNWQHCPGCDGLSVGGGGGGNVATGGGA